MNFMRPLSAFIIAATALLVGGCATASKSTAMVASVPIPVTKHAESVSVTVSGGTETSSMGASQVSNIDFAEAIKISVLQSGLFAKISDKGAADYNLDVQIVQLVQPMFGFSFTVTLEATWRLTHHSDQKMVWEKSVTTPFTAAMGDAFAGVTRLRLANEGAARTNI